MVTKRSLLTLIAALSLLSGCAYRNNYPDTLKFPNIADNPRALRLYVDANGTFFPNDWRDKCLPACAKIKRGFSLLATARTAAGYRAHIAAEEKRQLAEVADYIAAHQRIFILIHGFNASENEVKKSYDRLTKRIAFEPGDGTIEFYWDGFVTRPPDAKFSIAPAQFWRTATAHSQTAGSRGLRRVLALAKNRTIILISHSRGASVILSALSNPPYRKDFQTRVERSDFDPDDGIDGSPDFLNPAPLPANNGNNLHLLMLAPAIGCIDFRQPDFRRLTARKMKKEGCSLVRALSPDVKSLAYTLNKADKVLGKYILPSEWYSATDFGFDPTLGDELRRTENWRALTPYKIKQEHGHDFNCYINNDQFAKMLERAGVRVTAGIEPDAPGKPCVKTKKGQRKP